MTARAFLGHAGSTFASAAVVDEAAGGRATRVELVLESVEVPPELGEDSPCFVLTFSGPPDHHLDQRIYALHHEVMGDVELFLVPVGPAHGRLTYEAVFNNP